MLVTTHDIKKIEGNVDDLYELICNYNNLRKCTYCVHETDCIEWNIKLYGISIPDNIREQTPVTLLDIVDYRLKEKLICETGKKIMKFKWVDDWGIEGSSGGWFIVKTSVISSMFDNEYTNSQIAAKVTQICRHVKKISILIDVMIEKYKKLMADEKFWKKQLKGNQKN